MEIVRRVKLRTLGKGIMNCPDGTASISNNKVHDELIDCHNLIKTKIKIKNQIITVIRVR
jgi:hypothetical protein